jgi:hypothetical protein
MRFVVRLVPSLVLLLAAIVVVQRFSVGRFEDAYRARLARAQEAGLLPRAGALPLATESRPKGRAAARAAPDASEPALVAALEALDEQAALLMAGPYAIDPEHGAASGAPDMSAARAYFDALDALDLGGPDAPGAGAWWAPALIDDGYALWLGGAHADQLARAPGGGALAARRLAQVLALQHHFAELDEHTFVAHVAREREVLDALAHALFLPHADPRALFEALDPWLAHLARDERFVAVLRGEFMRELSEQLLPHSASDDRRRAPDSDWRRALCRLECFEDCVRALTLPARDARQPERDARGRLIPPPPPAGDPTHELVDIELLAQRHRRALALARVALALAAHGAREGAFPARLDALEAQLGGALPLDPAGGLPFVYRREGATASLGCRAVTGLQFELRGGQTWLLPLATEGR